MDPARAKEISEEYMSSLADLTINSKPLITMLTMLADENIEYAPVIVETIEKHITTVRPDFKLPILYLIDSIVKNIQPYRKHFNLKIANIFCDVFSKVNEKVREKMFQLRMTWNDVFPQTKLYTLDIKVNHMDPNWPVTAQAQTTVKSPAIHVNPNFFKKQQQQQGGPDILTDELRKKQYELLELEKKKRELERDLTKKTQSVQNKQQQHQINRVPVAGAPMPSVASLPPIPKINKQGTNRRDPRLARQQPSQDIPSKRPKIDQSIPPPAPHINGESSTTKETSDTNRSDKSKSDIIRKRSSDDRHKSKNSTSKSSSSSHTGPSKRSSGDRTDRKRHRDRSPVSKPHKRSREKSPAAVQEVGKRDSKEISSKKGSGHSNGTSSRISSSNNKEKGKSISPKTSGDVDLRVPLKSNGKLIF